MKKKVLGFQEHSDIDEILDYVTSPKFGEMNEEGEEENDGDYTGSDDDPEEDNDKEESPKKENKIDGHSLFFYEAIGALDLIKSIELSVLEKPENKDNQLKPYFKELANIVNSTQPNYRSILETWEKIESLAQSLKKASPQKINSNDAMNQLKKDSKELRDRRDKGDIDEEEFKRKAEVLKKKAIAEIDPNQMVSLVDYSKASDYLAKAIEKFKKGAEIELKRMEKKGRGFDSVVSDMQKLIKAKRSIKTSREDVKSREEKEKEQAEEREKKQTTEHKSRIETL